jgi:Cu-Zn family superoxide dismutase
MKLIHSSAALGLFSLLASVTVGCNSSSDSGGKVIAMSSGAWVVYDMPYAGMTGVAGVDPMMANPIDSKTVAGSATAWDMGGKMKLQLTVSGLPAGRGFGAHLHKLACNDTKAGGHYENNMWPADSSANDPTYANKDNEAWLDFTTDSSGKASPETTVAWLPRSGAAKSIIVHHKITESGGVAGAKLACLPITFTN